MTAFILQMLALSLTGGAAALLAYAACALLRRLHTPARWLSLLWGVAALRFVLPWGIPVAVRRPQSLPLAHALAAVQNNLPQAPVASAAATGSAVTTVTAAAPQYAWAPLAARVLAMAWLVGSTVLVARAVFGYIKLRRQLSLACKTVDGCYTCAAVDAPLTFGILRPRIYMPQSLQGTARRAVLLHERTHISHGDTLTKPLVYLVACLHWWNPLAWLTFRELERTMESACDEAAICGANPAERTLYCENMLTFAQHKTTPGSLAFGRGRVKERVRHVLGFRRPTTALLLLSAGCLLLVGTACMARPALTTLPPADETPKATQPAVQPAATAAPASSTAAPATPAAEPSAPSATLSFLCPVAFTRISRLMENGHRGDDLVAPKGTPVYAAEAGTVTAAAYHVTMGNYVVLNHGTDENDAAWTTEYTHLDSLTVEPGQTVARGEQLGTVGDTGTSTGEHLHLELRCGDTLLPPSEYMNYPQTP